MYIADLFNQNNLLQHFGSYVNKQRNSNSDEFHFHATIALMSIYKIRMLHALCLKQMQASRDRLTVKDDKIIFLSPTLVELLTLIKKVIRNIPSIIKSIVLHTWSSPFSRSVSMLMLYCQTSGLKSN